MGYKVRVGSIESGHVKTQDIVGAQLSLFSVTVWGHSRLYVSLSEGLAVQRHKLPAR